MLALIDAVLHLILALDFIARALKHWRISLAILALTGVACYVFGPVALIPGFLVLLLVGCLADAGDAEWEAKGLGHETAADRPSRDTDSVERQARRSGNAAD